MKTVTLRTGKGEHLTYHQVRVRELTVAEVREWLNDSQGTGYRDPIHALALPEIGLDELARMTDRTASELEAFAPSELQLLADAARELNPFFFRLQSALQMVTRAHLGETEPPPSTRTSAGSSVTTDTPTS